MKRFASSTSGGSLHLPLYFIHRLRMTYVEFEERSISAASEVAGGDQCNDL